MFQASFIDHIQSQGCIFLPQFSEGTTQVYRNIYNGYEASFDEETWITWSHAIAFCLDMDIDMPAELAHRVNNYLELGLD